MAILKNGSGFEEDRARVKYKPTRTGPSIRGKRQSGPCLRVYTILYCRVAKRFDYTCNLSEINSLTVCGLFSKEAGDYSSEAQMHSTNLQPDVDEGEVYIVEFQNLHAALSFKE